MDEPKNLVALLRASCQRFAERPLFGTKRGSAWTWTSYGEFEALVDALRGGLAGLGVGQGDRVAIVAGNRVEWAVAAYAAYSLGAIFVPMYEAQLADDWRFILADSEAKVAIGANEHITAELERIQREVASLEHVVGLERPDTDERSYASLLRLGRAVPVPAADPEPESLAGLIYTSGTTGKPKGVMLSHKNLSSNIAAVLSVFPVVPEDRSLSFLPWAHAYGQVAELHMMMAAGGSTAFNDALDKLIANLADVRPTILVAVPRIFNKLYASVQQKVAERPAPVQALFRRGVRNAVKLHRGEKLGPLSRLGVSLADRLIFSEVRAKLGGRLKYAITASAALDQEVAEFIDALGIPVYEGYGLTETSPAVSMNIPGARRMGSVGRPIPGVRVEADATASPEPGRGEIIVYGPNVMKGYYKRPDDTASALREDGGLRTGDLGFVDDDGYLHITGRIKEQYKLENGKYVMPTPLEEELKLSPYIANVMITGANRPYNVAVVVPDRAALGQWERREHMALGDVTRDPRVRQLLEAEIEQHGAKFRGFEKVKDFAVVADDFTTDNGLLTPTLKVKRRDVLARYGAELDALYAQPAQTELR